MAAWPCSGAGGGGGAATGGGGTPWADGGSGGPGATSITRVSPSESVTSVDEAARPGASARTTCKPGSTGSATPSEAGPNLRVVAAQLRGGRGVRGEPEQQPGQPALERLRALPRHREALIGARQERDALVPRVPGAGQVTEVLLAVREVEQRPGRRIEPLTFGELRAGRREVAVDHRDARRFEQGFGGGGIVRAGGPRVEEHRRERCDDGKGAGARSGHFLRPMLSTIGTSVGASGGASDAGAAGLWARGRAADAGRGGTPVAVVERGGAGAADSIGVACATGATIAAPSGAAVTFSVAEGSSLSVGGGLAAGLFAVPVFRGTSPRIAATLPKVAAMPRTTAMIPVARLRVDRPCAAAPGGAAESVESGPDTAGSVGALGDVGGVLRRRRAGSVGSGERECPVTSRYAARTARCITRASGHRSSRSYASARSTIAAAASCSPGTHAAIGDIALGS